MDNLQKPKKPKTDPYGAKCQEVIRLKYEDFSYSEIARKTRIPLNTIKEWFRTGGLLVSAYEAYRDEQNDVAHDEARQAIKKNVKTAADMLVALLGSELDPVKLRATLAILDRELGKPKGEDDDGYGDISYEQLLKRARAKRKEKQEAANRRTAGSHRHL